MTTIDADTDLVSSRYQHEGHDITELTLRTRVPENWLAVDQETGDVWQWSDGAWERARVEVLVLPRVSKPEESES